MNGETVLALPLVSLRGLVVYPKLLSHVDIGRDKSLAAVEYAMEHDRLLLMAAQLDSETENPGYDDIYHVGTLVKI